MKLADLGRPARVLFSGSAFVFFWSGGAALSLIALPLEELRGGSDEERRRRCQGWVRWGFRLFHGYMRLWGLTDYDPAKVELELPEGPYVMISNHPTLVDVTAIVSVAGELAIVVKRDYWRSLIRRLLERCGHIQGGEEGSAVAAASVAVQAMERLAEGRPVLIFPEGTRSPEGGLHEFQRGAFEIARRAQVPLVPVLITADPPWLMKHQRWYQVPKRMNQMRLRNLEGAPIEVPTEPSRSSAKRWRGLYTHALEALAPREAQGVDQTRDGEC